MEALGGSSDSEEEESEEDEMPMAGIGCVFMFMYVHVRLWICGIFVFTYVHLGACLLVRRIFDIMQYGTYDHFFFVKNFFL